MRASAVLPLVAVFFLTACAGPVGPTGRPESARPSNASAGPELGGVAATASPASSDVCHTPWIPLDVSPLCFEGYDLQFRADGRCQRCVKVNASPAGSRPR